jgi:hypothetical protein
VQLIQLLGLFHLLFRRELVRFRLLLLVAVAVAEVAVLMHVAPQQLAAAAEAEIFVM